MFKFKTIFIAIPLILIAVILLVAYYYSFSAPQKEAEEERVVVNLNASQSDLVPKLKEQGYIRSERAFNFVLKIKNYQIQPGGYKISKSMNAWQIADILANHPYEKWVIIPEGLRAEETADKLQNKLNWDNTTKAKFLFSAKEGYMYPDTYLFNIDSTGQEAAQRMINQFNEKTANLFEEAEKQNIRNDTVVILASLIQREAGSEEQMPLIAGIIWNRWLKGMNFQIDAAIQYVLGKEGNYWPVISKEDYKTDSLYNTYLYKGKPPAPICNPGLKAMEAVVYPEESDYLYYLHDKEGQIHPAKTYEEHLENVGEWLR